MASDSSQSVQIVNEKGMHARAAAKFVNLAKSFQSEVQISYGKQVVNGKSIMGILLLAAGVGSNIEIIAKGADKAKALKALVELVASGFGE